jgi:hypothetical protein
MVLSVMMEG